MKENSNIDHQAPWSRVRGDFSFERDTDQIVLLSKSSRENETALPKREENSNFEHMSMNVEPHCRPQMLQSKSHEQMVRALFQLQLFQNHLSTSAIFNSTKDEHANIKRHPGPFGGRLMLSMRVLSS